MIFYSPVRLSSCGISSTLLRLLGSTASLAPAHMDMNMNMLEELDYLWTLNKPHATRDMRQTRETSVRRGRGESNNLWPTSLKPARFFQGCLVVASAVHLLPFSFAPKQDNNVNYNKHLLSVILWWSRFPLKTNDENRKSCVKCTGVKQLILDIHFHWNHFVMWGLKLILF